MKKIIKELEALGANVEEVEGGLKLNGNWEDEYFNYNKYFVEICGGLRIFSAKYTQGNYLNNLKRLEYLTVDHAITIKDLLINLETLGSLWMVNTKQKEHFLRNLKVLGTLWVGLMEQRKDFLKNVTILGFLVTDAVQHKDFLRGVKTLGTIETHTSIQDKDFLRNVKHGGLVRSLLETQHKDFLSNASGTVKYPYFFLGGHLYLLVSEKKINDDTTICGLNPIGRTEIVYAIKKKEQIRLIDK